MPLKFPPGAVLWVPDTERASVARAGGLMRIYADSFLAVELEPGGKGCEQGQANVRAMTLGAKRSPIVLTAAQTKEGPYLSFNLP